MQPLKTYIVEDSPVIRENLIATLEELLPVKVVGSAEDESEALQWLARAEHSADLLIVDIFLKRGSGLGVLRAARAMQAHFGRKDGAVIALTKNLPVASGIGGGSADAAATLRGLAQLWDIETYPSELQGIAETLGSDVPVCVESRSAWMEGRGEQISRAFRVPAASMVLVNPGVAVPTGKVFAALATRSGIGAVERQLPDNDPWSLAEYLRSTTNDLEAPALAIAPVIGEVLAMLRAQAGVYLARMSGSGATCFAIFEDEVAAERAAKAIEAAHSDWWVQPARIVV